MQISFDPKELFDMSDEQYSSLMNLMKVFRNAPVVPEPASAPSRTEEDINQIVNQMYNYGLTMFKAIFSVDDLYEGAIKLEWNAMGPQERKAIGRTFSKFVRNVSEESEVKIVSSGRTRQNLSLYCVEKKEA